MVAITIENITTLSKIYEGKEKDSYQRFERIAENNFVIYILSFPKTLASFRVH